VLLTQWRVARPRQAVTLIVGSKRWSLLITGGVDEMFMTRSINATPKTIEQHLTVHSDKSVAYVRFVGWLVFNGTLSTKRLYHAMQKVKVC